MGSNPTEPATLGTDCSNYEQQIVRILEHGFWLKKRGYRESTFRKAIHSLKAIAKKCDLFDTERVKECIDYRRVSEGQKEKLCNVFDKSCNHNRLNWVNQDIKESERAARVYFHTR